MPSNEHRDWHKQASLQLKNQEMPNEPILYCPEAVMTIYSKDRRRFDLSNRWESIADLFVDLGILADDSFDVLPKIVLIYGGLDKENQRAEIEIETNS